MPPSVLSWRNVNWVARNSKASGFSTWIAWVVGVSGREYTTWILNPLGGPANARSPIWLETQNTTAVFRDSGRKEASRGWRRPSREFESDDLHALRLV